jgi:acetyltransferase-like isoleucine patch superfamily enzyme
MEIQKAIKWATEKERGSRSLLSPFFIRLYRIRPLRPIILRAFLKLEGGQMFSVTLREILRCEFGITVGKYSYGGLLRPGILPAGTNIGNYCSFADGITVFRRNHPIERVSLHPFFFNHKAGVLQNDVLLCERDNPLTIGHDVWIGAHAIVLPKCKSIGNGAIVGAGAVVTRDVPAFAVVAGNPARNIGSRFPPEVQTTVCASGWWLRSLPELLEHLPLFTVSASNIDLGILRRIGATSPGRNPPLAADITPQRSS